MASNEAHRDDQPEVDVAGERAEFARGLLELVATAHSAINALQAIVTDAEAQLVELTVASAGPNSRDCELAMRSLAREVAARLRVSNLTAQKHLDAAFGEVRHFPGVVQAQAEGLITRAQALTILQEGRLLVSTDIEQSVRDTYAAQALEVAPNKIPGKLKSVLQRLAERLSTEPATKRHEIAVQDRSVWVADAEDGMAYLTAFLPNVIAHGIAARLADGAKQRCADDPRTAAQWKADALSALLINADVPDAVHEHCDEPGCTESLLKGITANVAITVSAETLVNVDDSLPVEPAVLNGSTIMSTTAAATLIGRHRNAIERWITHPVTNQVIAVDARFPSSALKRQVLARDGATCRNPGCTSKRHLDIDHTKPWSTGGKTRFDNLAVLCRPCHMVKDFTAWRLEQDRYGSLTWTSPLGYQYVDEPPPY